MKASESLLRRLLDLRTRIEGINKDRSSKSWKYVSNIYERIVFGDKPSLTAMEVTALNEINKKYQNIVIPKKSWANERVCFSGFRSKEMEKEIIKSGGVIHTTINRDTTYLIVKSKLKTKTSKILKAEKYGVKIVVKEDFYKIK